MKYIVILCVLLATTFAQDAGKCKVKAMDSFYMLMGAYGSLYNGSQSNQYYSFVGEIEDVILFLSDNPSGSVRYTNATLVIRNGATGASVIAGSFITFRQNNKDYHFQVINGQKGNCSSVASGPVPQYSKILSSLIQIYPFPGMPPKPGEYAICQGIVGDQTLSSIVNLVWDASEQFGGFKTVSVLTENQSNYAGIVTHRPLTDADKHFFTNPCPQGAEDKEIDQLIGLIHALHHH